MNIDQAYFTRGNNPFAAGCYAPHKSLYFGHGGVVLACCQNKTYELGRYPQLSVDEIWQGAAVAQLRAALNKFDFSMGCQGCLTQIECKNYAAAKATPYDSLHLNDNGLPSDMQFELINTCNLECVMCSGEFSSLIREKREKLPKIAAVYDDAFVQQLIPFIPHLKQAQFYGGEPFLIPLYFTIWELMQRINPAINIRVQTNATLLNSRLKAILEQGRFTINVSLDAADKATYESIRVNADFDVVMHNLQWFANYAAQRGLNFGISACAMQNNVHQLPDLAKLCNSLQASLYIHPLITPHHLSLRAMQPAQLNIIVENLLQQQKLLPTATSMQQHNAFVLLQFIAELQSTLAQPPLPLLHHFDNLNQFTDMLLPELAKHFDQQTVATTIGKFKEATVGLENNPSVVNKFRSFNIYNRASLTEMVGANTTASVARLRYLILNVMHG